MSAAGILLSASISFSASDGEKAAKPDEVSAGECGEKSKVRCRPFTSGFQPAVGAGSTPVSDASVPVDRRPQVLDVERFAEDGIHAAQAVLGTQKFLQKSRHHHDGLLGGEAFEGCGQLSPFISGIR